MPAITITDLTNAKTDVDHLSDLVNSTAPTATDRLGNTKSTWAGKMIDIDAAVASEIQAVTDAKNAAQTAQAAAETAQTGAETAQTQAGIYSSLAATGAKFFNTIALGNAGVADAATFGVVAGGADALAWPTVYRRDSAGTQTRIGIVLTEDGAETFSVRRVVRRSVTVAGLAPVTGTSQLSNTTQLYNQPLPAGALVKLEFYIQAIGDGTVDVVLFQRSQVTSLLNFTERARITVNVVAGLNTFLSGALTGLAIQKGDYIGLVRDATGATPGHVTAGGLGVLRNASATPAADATYINLAAAGSNLRATVVADALESDSLGPTLGAAIAKNTAGSGGTGEIFTLGAPAVSAGTTVAGSTGGTFWYEHPVVRRSYLRSVSMQADIAGVGEVVVLRRFGTVNTPITNTIKRFPVEFAAGLNTFTDITFQGYILEPGDSVGITVAGSVLRRDNNMLMAGSYIATGVLGAETTVWTSQVGPMFNWTVEPLREVVEAKQRTAYDVVDFRTATAPKAFLDAGGWTPDVTGLLSPVGTGAFTQRLTQRSTHRTEQIVARWDCEAQGAGSKIAFGYDSATCVVDGTTGFFVVCNSGANSAAIPATYQQQALPAALAAGRKFRVELISNRRLLTYRYTDLANGQSLTTTEDYSAGTSITPVTGRLRGSAVAINLAGQTRILTFKQFSAQLRPTLACMGDSITEQTGVLQTAGFPGLLTTSLGGLVSVGALAGSTSEDYNRFVNSMVLQRPKAILSYYGTNDTDTALAAFTQNKNFLVTVCKAAGIQLGFGVVAPSAGGTFTNLNAFLLGLASDVKKIRFDYALTTGNDGVTQSAALFQGDLVHPNATGHAAMYSRIQADWPELWDL